MADHAEVRMQGFKPWPSRKSSSAAPAGRKESIVEHVPSGNRHSRMNGSR